MGPPIPSYGSLPTTKFEHNVKPLLYMSYRLNKKKITQRPYYTTFIQTTECHLERKQNYTINTKYFELNE